MLQIPSQEVFGTPKCLLRSCLGIQTPTHKVFGRLGSVWVVPHRHSLPMFNQHHPYLPINTPYPSPTAPTSSTASCNLHSWYLPAGSSDVVAFGNAYAKSFGYSVFKQATATASPGPGGNTSKGAPNVGAEAEWKWRLVNKNNTAVNKKLVPKEKSGKRLVWNETCQFFGLKMCFYFYFFIFFGGWNQWWMNITSFLKVKKNSSRGDI